MKLVTSQSGKIDCFKAEDICTHNKLIRQYNRFSKTNDFSNSDTVIRLYIF